MKTKPIILIFTLLLIAGRVAGQCTTTLTSGAGSNNQTVCISAVMSSITWTTDATAITSSPPHGLPAGVNPILDSGVSLTISGTPSVAGSFNYTINLSGPGGVCSVSGTLTVNALTGIPVFTQGATSVCKGASNEDYDASAANGTIVFSVLPAGAGTINSSTGVMNWDNGYSGIATITATATGLCGTTSADRVVTVYPGNPAAAGAITGPSNVCYGASSAVFSVGAITDALTYTWTLPSGVSLVSGGSTASIIVDFAPGASSPKTIKVKGTNPCGSGAEATISVSIYGQLQGGTIGSSQTICNGADVVGFTSSVAATGGSGSFTYTWQSTTNGSAIAGDANWTDLSTGPSDTYDHGTLSTTTRFVRKAVDATCSAPVYSNIITVTVRPTPTASISGSTTVCQGSSAPLITFTNTQPLAITVTYNINGGTSATIGVGASTTATVSAPTTTPGSFVYNLESVVYQTTPTCSNTISGTETVTVRPTPTASISGSTTVCQGSAAPLITFTNPQSLAITVTYNINGGTPATIGVGASTTATVPAPTTTAGNFAYNLVSVVYQTSPTCSNTISGTETIVVRPTPTASISGSTTVCQGSSAPLITFTNTQPLAITVTYNINGGTPATIGVGASTTATVSVSTATPGDFAYNLQSVVYQTSPTCSNTISGTETVTVRPTPTASISGSTTVCQGSASPLITFTNTQPLAITVTYNINGGTPATIGVGASTTATVPAATTTAGNFAYNLVSVVYQTSPTCSNTISGTETIIVRPTPTASISGTTSVCKDGAEPLITFTNPHPLAITVTYNINGGSPITIGVGASASSTISVSTATPGSYAYNLASVVYQTSPTCSNTISGTQTITVNPLPTLSSVSQVAQICSGAKATINLTGLIGTSSAVTYQIGTNTPVTKTGISVTGGVANFLTNDLDAVNNGKTFTITSVTNENTGCSSAFSQSTLLIVNTATIPTLTGDDTPCINSTVTYTTQPGMNTNSYVWTFSGGGTSTGGGTNTNNNTITVTWTSLGSHDISVNFTNSSGCTAASATTISPVVSALPTPAINGPSSVCINSTGNVYYTLAGMSGYDWDITGGSITSGGNNNNFAVVTWTSDVASSISVNYTNASGCAATLPTVYPVTVNPLPVVTTPGTASTCSGTSPGIALTASVASSFTWTVGTISGSISGATSGSGNTINQVLGNASNSSSGTVEYLVTPTSITGSCAGSPYSIVVTVLPLPVVTNSAATTICSGTGPNITLTSSVPGSFTWTVGATSGGITGASADFGNTINQILTNPGNTSAGTQQYLIVPTSTTGTCVGNTYSIVVTVNPTPVVTTAATASICSGTSPVISLTASAQSTFSWTVGAIAGSISGASAGSGTTINQVLSNPSNTVAGTVEYLVTPVSTTGSCTGAPYSIIVTVNPLPVVTTPGTASTCSGTSPGIALTASVASSFTWTVGTISGSISGATSGSGNTINQVLGNASNSSSGTVEYLVTPTSITGSCAGSPYSIVVTVLPLPVVTNSAATTICSGTGPNITLTSSVPGSFTWTVGSISGGITGASAGSGNTINQILTNPGNVSSGTVQYLVTPTSTTGTCSGSAYSIVVTVNPTPIVTTAATVSTCSGTTPVILLTASTQSTFTWTVGAISGSISGASAGSGSTISQVLSNPSNTVVGTVEYLVTPVSITGSCTGAPYSIIVTVNPLPYPGLVGPLTARITSTGNLYSTEAGMNNYLWTVSSGGSVTAGGTTGSNTVTVTWNTTGPQSVSVKYTNTNNCTALAPTPASVTVNPLPSVSGVGITGTAVIGNTLTGTYSYTDGGGGGSISTFRWLREGSEIPGEVLNSYLLTGADKNKNITFEVTPKTTVGSPNTGTPLTSPPTIPVEDLSEIPVADQVCIEGVRTAGNILKGKYRYTHSKTEGSSTYKWYLNGVAIPSATSTQYTLLATDIDNDEDITFEVTPVSSNVLPVTGTPASSNPMAKMPLVPTDYSVAVSSVPLTASPAGGIFSGPGVTNGIFSPSTVGIGGSPYSIQYLLNIVNSSTSCSQSVWKTVNVVTNTTEFSSFKDVYCQTDDPDEIVITGLLTGLTSLGFTHTDADAIVGSTAWTVTVDPRKMRPGNNKDYLSFSYKDSRGIVYQISKSFVVDSVGTGLQIINLGSAYCAETPKVNISVTGTYPSGGTGAWTSSLLSDLAATSASVNVALVPAGPTYPLSYQYTSPLGCKSIVINKSVTVNPLPNPSFTIAPFYNIDGGAATLVPVQSPGTFSGNGVSGDKLYPDIAGLGEHTINYRITDNKGCVDDLDIKTTVKTAQGTFTDIPAIICYRDTTFNVKVTGLPSGMTVNSFVNTRNSIDHIVGATDANYSVKAAGHGLDTLTLSYKLDNVDYWISKVVNIDSLGLVQVQNLFAGDKVCDNRAPFELFTSMPGGVFTGPVAGNYLDPTKATGASSVLYKYTNSRTGCSTSTTVPFIIIPAPLVSFVPKDVCIESNRDSTYFLNTTVSSDPVFEYTWTFAEVGAAPSNRKDPAYLYKAGGIHAVSLNVRTVSGCNVTKTSNVDLGIRPIADFTWKNDCFATGAKLNLTDATFTNFPVISRTWNFNNGSLISSDLNPEYAMQDTGYVQVKYIVRTSYANCADTVSRRIYLRPTITIPKDGFYYQDFEAGKAGWGKDDSDPNLIWSFGTPNRTKINKAKSGVAAWYTKYESDKQGKIDTTSVISPCFDFTNIQRPMITLQAFKIFEKNRNGAALQYKTEGSDWKYVGTLEDGINWYNSTLINGKPGGEKIGWTTLSDEDADVDYVPSSHALDELKGKKNVKFRLAYGSDGNSLDKEGIAFDDIWIGERTRKVLLEHFTNTFSKKGSEATAFVNKIIKARDKDVINIQYHTNFPDDDPFYMVNPGDASARIFSYGLSKVPYSLIDGGYSNGLYASLSDYKTAPLDSNDLSRRTLLDSKFSITITPKITGGVLTVNSTVTALTAFTSDNLILYLVVTEKEALSDKPAALGELNFKNVFRKFIPDAGGIDLRKTWTKGDSFAIPEKTWVIENIKNNVDIEVIAFVQNSQTKEVYQVTSGSLKTGKSVIDNSNLDKNAIGTENTQLPSIITFGLYPNPASDKLRIEFSEKLVSETDIRIFDFQGAVKKTYKVASGESDLFIEDIGLKAGIYLVRISSGGVDLGFRKLIITGN